MTQSHSLLSILTSYKLQHTAYTPNEFINGKYCLRILMVFLALCANRICTSCLGADAEHFIGRRKSNAVVEFTGKGEAHLPFSHGLDIVE